MCIQKLKQWVDQEFQQAQAVSGVFNVADDQKRLGRLEALEDVLFQIRLIERQSEK